MNRRTWISVFIVLVLILHLAPLAQQLTRPYQTFWPIMAWGMYRTAAEPPIETTTWSVTAETASGRSVEVESWDAGLGATAFKRFYLNPLSRGDTARARELSEILEPVDGEAIERLVAHGTRYQVVAGTLKVQPETPQVYSIER